MEFKCDRCGARPEYSLELYEFRGRQRLDPAELGPDSSFTLRHVPYGDYQMIVSEPGGNAVYEQFLTVGAITPPQVVHITGTPPPKPPAGGVSLAQLQHPPTKKAYEAALAAQKFAEAGDHQRAADELEKAIHLSPYYAAAYVNLAAQHLRMGRYQEAESECRRAIEIAGRSALVLVDLASAQYALKEFEEAEGSARQALQLEPDNPRAHYVLGLALATDARTVHEGLEHLQKAAEKFPAAREQAEKIRGRRY